MSARADTSVRPYTTHHADVERADVDAELERVRRDDGAHGAFPQALLDLAPPLRQVAASIAANLLLRAWLAAEVVLQIRRQDFRRQAALREDDDLKVPFEEFGRDASRFAEI